MKTIFDYNQTNPLLLEALKQSSQAVRLFDSSTRPNRASVLSNYKGPCAKSGTCDSRPSFVSFGTIPHIGVEGIISKVEVLCKFVRFEKHAEKLLHSKYRSLQDHFYPSNNNVSRIDPGRKPSYVTEVALNANMIKTLQSFKQACGYEDMELLGVLLINLRLTCDRQVKGFNIMVKAHDVINQFIIQSPNEEAVIYNLTEGNKTFVNNKFIMDAVGEEQIVIGSDDACSSTFIPVAIYDGFKRIIINGSTISCDDVELVKSTQQKVCKELNGVSKIKVDDSMLLLGTPNPLQVEVVYKWVGCDGGNRNRYSGIACTGLICTDALYHFIDTNSSAFVDPQSVDVAVYDDDRRGESMYLEAFVEYLIEREESNPELSYLLTIKGGVLVADCLYGYDDLANYKVLCDIDTVKDPKKELGISMDISGLNREGRGFDKEVELERIKAEALKERLEQEAEIEKERLVQKARITEEQDRFDKERVEAEHEATMESIHLKNEGVEASIESKRELSSSSAGHSNDLAELKMITAGIALTGVVIGVGLKLYRG
jgi:hypothetical protein